MSGKSSENEKLARQLYRNSKQRLDLLRGHSPVSSFERAVQRLFGIDPGRGKNVRIGKREFSFSSASKNLVSFLPARWREELDKAEGTWAGCENWWARYPLIAWVEMKAGDDIAAGYLKLNSEVGPVSDHKVRKCIVEAIKVAAHANGLDRIQFPAGASDKGRLYSRFLQRNSVAVTDIHDADEVERKLVALIAGFDPEFELVASAIPQFVCLNDSSKMRR